MSSYHPFPRLPPELQHEIWNLSIPPRQVELRPDIKGIPMRNLMTRTWEGCLENGFRSSTKTPPALQARRVSRAYLESAGGYSKAFTRDESPVYIWVNFALDTIALHYFHSVLDWVDMLGVEYDHITRLRLTYISIFGDSYGQLDDMRRHVQSSKIKELTLNGEWGNRSGEDYHWLYV
ncbi:hypothetical protein PG996_008795 [Apiospora saccharicola]|uniref:2EXR domain-containing protein n=1 Tax=Apiospora saccharicola TaxID=335842 RepID=A0ABR1V2A7_9PEZI